jgi:hypothetical protein
MDIDEIYDKEEAMATLFGFDLSSDRLKDDKDLVLAILQQNPSAFVYAFRYASDRLKDDEEVVMADAILAFLLNTTEEAMGLASERVKGDIDFCIECAKINSDASKWFVGEAKELFEKYKNDLKAVQKALPKYIEEKEQQKANEALMDKIKKSQPTTPNFKRELKV